jgi:hypothetical protein
MAAIEEHPADQNDRVKAAKMESTTIIARYTPHGARH